MRAFFPGLLVALIVSIGCSASGTPGGPGTTSPKKPVVGQADETFTLGTPTLSTTVKQGETKAVSISIKRGKSFDEDVALKFADVPKGVAIDGNPVIKHGETEAKLTLKAADDAAVGDFTVKVTGRPTKGTDATSDLKITVEKK